MTGQVYLHNLGPGLVDFDSGQPLTAILLDAAGQIVGTNSGPTAGTGVRVHIGPGGTQRIPFIGGTDSPPSEHYATPAGTYTLVVIIPVHDDHGHGQIVTAPTSLHISDPPTP